MRHLLVLLLLAGLGVGGYYGYQRFFAPGEARACKAVDARCDLTADQARACRQVIDDVASIAGPDTADKLTSCLREAPSCAETAACLAGAGASVVSTSTAEFLNGLSRGTF